VWDRSRQVSVPVEALALARDVLGHGHAPPPVWLRRHLVHPVPESHLIEWFWKVNSLTKLSAYHVLSPHKIVNLWFTFTDSKQFVDGFEGELAFWNHLTNTLCEIGVVKLVFRWRPWPFRATSSAMVMPPLQSASVGTSSILSHTVYQLNGLRKSTLPQNSRLSVGCF
jgi:hypothetical protein